MLLIDCAQLKEECEASSESAKARGRAVTQLTRQVAREQYLAKKTARVTEMTESKSARLTQVTIDKLKKKLQVSAEESQAKQRVINELTVKFRSATKAVEHERRKNKNEVLADRRLDVKRLQIQRAHLQNSCSALKQRFELACVCVGLGLGFMRTHTHTHSHLVHVPPLN